MSKVKEQLASEIATSERQPPQLALTAEQIINALANELVRSRVRFRALLKLLASRGVVEMQQYVEVYEQEEDLSFAALSDLLLVSVQHALQEHPDWMNSSAGARFAASVTQNRVPPRLTLTQNVGPTPALEEG